MPDLSTQLDLIEIFGQLNEVPLRNGDQAKALHEIVQRGRQVLGSRVCSLTLVYPDDRRIEQAAFAGFEDIEARWGGKPISLTGIGEGNYLDFDLIAKGELVERYRLKEDGQGVANPAMAKKYDLNSLLAYPLWSEGRLVGYINHFSSKSETFTSTEKRLLQLLARQVVIFIERLNYEFTREQTLTTLSTLNEVSRSLATSASGQFLQSVAQGVCKILNVPTCVVWEHDKSQKRLRIAATTSDVDEEYKRSTIDPDDPKVLDRIRGREAVQIEDVTSSDASYIYKEAARRHGWVSLLTVPIYVDKELAGMLDAYSKRSRHFKEWEKETFTLFANETALSLHQVEKRVEELNSIVQEVTQARSEDELFEITLDSALKLVRCERGWISRLNVGTGELKIIASSGDPIVREPLRLGQGITGEAMKTEVPLRVDDVHDGKHPYEEFWPDTKSELAIPLVIQNAQVRVGRDIKHGSKRIGVLNVESRIFGAFFNLDEDCLLTLARAAAIACERLETDWKFGELARIEREIFQKKNFDFAVQHILRAITDTLGYQFVNISLVDYDAGRIRTHYVAGLSPEQEKKFKKLADHPLEGPKLDIQADIVKSRQIEVPGEDDPRFDLKIFEEFGHRDLIRVFVPMISSAGNRVVGTIEAGYQRALRPYIYERDVTILRDFVDFITEALEQRRADVLERIMHEFRAPASALRSNVSYLKRKFTELEEHKIQNKLDDLGLDTELVLLQVSKVEHFLGGASPSSRPQRTVVYRDIIIKTINQLKPRIAESGYDASKVHYNPQDVGKMVLYLDPVKLNQVVFNLLINAIKYAEEDPAKFAIRIDLDETREQFVVKFKDWGIGIGKGFEEKIFEQGFRTPQAKSMFVTGSGLGLTIARGIMKEIGGDLKLANNYKPTEFQIILPKTLKEMPR